MPGQIHTYKSLYMEQERSRLLLEYFYNLLLLRSLLFPLTYRTKSNLLLLFHFHEQFLYWYFCINISILHHFFTNITICISMHLHFLLIGIHSMQG